MNDATMAVNQNSPYDFFLGHSSKDKAVLPVLEALEKCRPLFGERIWNSHRPRHQQ